jgi:hypothetical protein
MRPAPARKPPFGCEFHQAAGIEMAVGSRGFSAGHVRAGIGVVE